MELMPKDLQIGLPRLYDTEDTLTDEMVIRIRYYDVNSSWEWLLIEYEPESKTAFGYVKGFENEWGYFSLEEMQSIPSIVRDENFQPIRFGEWKQRRD